MTASRSVSLTVLSLCLLSSHTLVFAHKGVTGSDSFCVAANGGAFVYDLSSMPTTPFVLSDSASDPYHVTAPTVDVPGPFSWCPDGAGPYEHSPAIQVAGGACIQLGLRAEMSAEALSSSSPGSGLSLTLHGGDDKPGCTGENRTVVYALKCDSSAPTSTGPNAMVEEDPACTYTVTWAHPAACGVFKSGYTCPQAPVPTPTPEQAKYSRHEIMGLTHFNMGTFTGNDGDPSCNSDNWNNGVNSSQAATFNPVGLNVSNWVESYKALGAKHAVLTAKHGCGFVLFDTKATLPGGGEYTYSVERQTVPSFGRDVAKEFVDTLTAAGLGTGFYYSTGNNYYLGTVDFKQLPNLLPGQVNVTIDEYNAIVFTQLRELWTNYGPFMEIWLDHGFSAAQEGQLKQMLNTLQPNTTAFNGFGVSPSPVKWVGTESGTPSYPIWQTGCETPTGNPDSKTFCPVGADTELQDPRHWFYVASAGVRPLSDLIAVYHDTVGSNSVLELDFAIDPTGNVHPSHAAQYKVFGDWIRGCYGTPVSSGSGNSSSITLEVGGASIDRVMIQEDISHGERVRAWSVTAMTTSGSTVKMASGTAVGHKRIAVSPSGAINVSKVTLTVSEAVGVPDIMNFAVFAPCASG